VPTSPTETMSRLDDVEVHAVVVAATMIDPSTAMEARTRM